MTLVEVLVAAAITTFVLAGVTAVFLSQGRQYQSMASRRDSQAGTRLASSLLENHLRMAGYGVDPNLAVEAYDSFDASTGELAGDTSYPDALVVHHRNPVFRRTVAMNGASAGQLEFTEALTDPLRQGQILLVLCAGATRYTYVTVGETVTAGTTVSLLAAGGDDPSPIGPPSDRFRNDVTVTALAGNEDLEAACYDTGEAVAVKVDRHAFFVGAFDDDEDADTPQTPYLMLHRGLDLNGDGNVDIDDAVPVASGVEQFQVAYVLNAAAGANPVVRGVTAADRVPDVVAWDAAATRPGWDDPYSAARRTADNPANIRQVRFTLVARGAQRNEAMSGDDAVDLDNPGEGALSDGTVVWRQMENLDGTPSEVFDPRGRHYLRTVSRLSVTPKNMMMRSQFVSPNHGG